MMTVNSPTAATIILFFMAIDTPTGTAWFLLLRRWPDGRVDRFFDTDGDRRIDYGQRLDEGGMVSLLRFDDDGDGEFDFEAPAPARMTGDAPHLTIILDSIPFELVRDSWEQGRGKKNSERQV